jgi:error-prone DNA polymerase
LGWHNPTVPWEVLEGRLSGRPPGHDEAPHSRRHQAYQNDSQIQTPGGPVTAYAELHCHSNFSFLDGASGPDALVEKAMSLGLYGLALTDHDGFYGAPLFAEVARRLRTPSRDLRTIYGAELSLNLPRSPQGATDPEGRHLLVLARGVEGYHRLAETMTAAHLRGEAKGRPVYLLDELAERCRGHCLVLTGCRKGAVRAALTTSGPTAAAAELTQLVELFGAEDVAVELIDHQQPGDSQLNDLLAELARSHRLPTVATNNVHYANPDERRLANAMAAIRARRSLADMDGWLPATGMAYLRSGAEMSRRFARYRAGRSVGIRLGPGHSATSSAPHPGWTHLHDLAADSRRCWI